MTKNSRQRLKWRISLLTMIAALPTAAWAQTAPAQDSTGASQSSASSSAATPAPAPQNAPGQNGSTSSTDTTVVTVTAQKPLIEHKIDRDVYDVKQDPQAATGAASDVLNNVPGVTVDNDGTVSLRGNSNAQVLSLIHI